VASSTQSNIQTQYSHIISLIPIAIAIGFLFGIFSVSLTEADTTTISMATIGSAVLYGFAIYSAQSLQNNLWQGYVHLASGIALLTTGLAHALYIIIGVSILVTFIKYGLSPQRDQDLDTILANASGWISLSGITVISEYLLYTVIFNQSLPYTTLNVDSILIVVLTLGVGNGISVVIGSTITRQSILQSLRKVITQSPPLFELLLLFVAAIIAAVLYQVNELTFLIIITFTVAQVIYGHRATELKRESTVRLNELTTLNTVAQAVSVHLELEDVLTSIYTEVNQLVDAQVIFVALYDSEKQHITYPLVMQDSKSVIWRIRPLSNGLTDYVIRNKQLLYINKSEIERIESLGIAPDLMDSTAYLGFPMMVGEKIIGVMGMLNLHHNDILGKTNLNVLQSIVNQASLALRNATLYDRTNKLATNLSHINHSVQDVMFNLNRDDALHAAAETAKSVTNADQIAIFLIDMQDKLTIHLAQSIGVSDSFQAKLENPDPYWFDSTDSNFRLVSDVKELDDPTINNLALIGNFRAFAEIPMRSGTTIVGYLVIYHEQPHQYPMLEIELLEMLTSQITVALDNSELLQALEVYASEQAELVHLTNITSSSLELESVVSDVSSALKKMLDVEQVEIGLYIQGRNDIEVYTPQESGYLDVDEYRLSDFPELQITTQSLLYYPKIILHSDKKVSEGAKAYISKRDCGMMTISPMVINNEVIGAVLITDSEETIFHGKERRLIEMATSQIAAQIHNAQIHTLTEEALVKRLEQLALIEDIGQKISRSLEPELINENVVEASLRSAEADIAMLALVKNETTLSVKCHIFNEQEITLTQYEAPLEQGIIGQVLRSGATSIIEDNRKSALYEPPTHGVNGTTYLSSLTVPLTKGNTVIGAINVESKHVNFFTDEHVGFIQSLARNAVISIDNATLLEDSKKQITVLTQLRSLALTASNTQSTNEMISTIVKTTIDMMDGNGGIIIPYNHDKKEFKQGTLGWIRLGGGLVQDMFFIPETLLYQVVHTRDMLLIDDVTQNSRYASYEQINQVNYASIAIIPIERRKQVTELLCVTFKNERTFVDQDRETIQLLQAQIANHIEGVMLSEEIRQSNVRMRAILDSTRDGIILLDSSGRLQDANVSAEELLNVELTRYRNEDFATLLLNHGYTSDDTQSYAELIKTARATYSEPERNHIREYKLYSNGRMVHIREVSSPVWGGNNTIVGRLLSLRDVSEERTLEEFRSRLQSMIVHDLRGPLGAIVSSMVVSEDILNKTEDSSMKDNLLQFMDVAKSSANDLMELVDSMLDIGKMQRSEMKLDLTTIPIGEIATTAYMSLMATFKQAEIEMKYDIPEDLPEVSVDEGLVGRIFTNLIQNALKYTPKGGEICITARLDEDHENMLQIMVSDTGPGIPEDMREQIFGQYITIDDKTQKQQRGSRGTGLGLTFCKLVVEEHGGHIQVSNDGPLSGATFSFTLPTVQ